MTYSGHGLANNTLLLSDCKEYEIYRIQEYFRGDKCKGLIYLPKIFVYCKSTKFVIRKSIYTRIVGCISKFCRFAV